MTAMRILAYYQPHEDSHEVQAALRLRFPQAAIAMRAGWMWSAASNAEHGCTHIRAPGFPGIIAAYVAIGAEVCDCELPRTAPPEEITDLPRFDEVSILSAGPNLRAELDAVPSRGLRLAINRAHVVGCDWHIANDGFALRGMIADGDVVRACRLRHAASIPGGRWFDLCRLGIHDGVFTPVCAFALVRAMGAKVVWLYGHDLIPGPGVVSGEGSWTESALHDLSVAVGAAIQAARESGITVNHVRMCDGAVVVDRLGSLAVAAEPEREAEPERPAKPNRKRTGTRSQQR